LTGVVWPEYKGRALFSGLLACLILQENSMKNCIRYALAFAFGLILATSAWAQWSSDPAKNLALADKVGSDQVQPKVKPLPDGGWWVSWFAPPVGYSVYLQRLLPNGVEQFRHDGLKVAALTNSSTEDYGLDVDTKGNALLAFLDTREGSNQQVTAAKMSPSGKALWGTLGVQLTKGPATHSAPKIAGTSDGDVVVAWTVTGSDNLNEVVLQKLDASGHPLWGKGIVFHEASYNYGLADLHAADNGSVIVSWIREQGFGSNRYIYANKLSSTGTLLWGKHVKVFDGGSLQFGSFPGFSTDGSGGAVFSWYSSSPALQCFAQHILADGSEAFPHNGSVASTDTTNVRVDPAVSYRHSTDEVFLFWTEEDSTQSLNGIYAQKFGPKGGRQWGQTGLVIVPLGTDSEVLPSNVQVGTGALGFWIDMKGFGNASIQAVRLQHDGKIQCAQFPVSTAMSNKGRPAADIVTATSLAAIAFEDDRIGNNGIYIQNVNDDCSLGQK
jgi:hypothetical protein